MYLIQSYWFRCRLVSYSNTTDPFGSIKKAKPSSSRVAFIGINYIRTGKWITMDHKKVVHS
jgi:hypothetical protein